MFGGFYQPPKLKAADNAGELGVTEAPLKGRSSGTFSGAARTIPPWCPSLHLTDTARPEANRHRREHMDSLQIRGSTLCRLLRVSLPPRTHPPTPPHTHKPSLSVPPSHTYAHTNPPSLHILRPFLSHPPPQPPSTHTHTYINPPSHTPPPSHNLPYLLRWIFSCSSLTCTSSVPCDLYQSARWAFCAFKTWVFENLYNLKIYSSYQDFAEYLNLTGFN